MKVIAVSGAMMTLGIADFGIEQLGHELVLKVADHWQMHPWQAMQILNATPLWQGDRAPIEPGEPGWKFARIKVVEDPHFPEDLIELRDKDENILVQFRNVGSLTHEHRGSDQR